MAKAGRVQHWKHGWIPISPEARAFVRGGGKGPRPGVVGSPAAVLDRPKTGEEVSSRGRIADFPTIDGPHGLWTDTNSVNPRFTDGGEYTINCLHCVQAGELRRRGYDVIATPLPKEAWRQGGRSTQWALDMWRTPPGSPLPKRTLTQATKVGVDSMVENFWPEGARGWVAVNWKDGSGGHIFSVEKVDGKPVYTDPQTGRQDASSYFDRAQKIVLVTRVDDLEPTDDVAQFAQVPRPQDVMRIRRRTNAEPEPPRQSSPESDAYLRQVLDFMGSKK